MLNRDRLIDRLLWFLAGVLFALFVVGMVGMAMIVLYYKYLPK